MQIYSLAHKPFTSIQRSLKNPGCSLTEKLALRTKVLNLALCSFVDSGIHTCVMGDWLLMAIVQLPSKPTWGRSASMVAIQESAKHFKFAVKSLVAAILVPLPALINPQFSITAYRWMALAPQDNSFFARVSRLFQQCFVRRSLIGLSFATIVAVGGYFYFRGMGAIPTPLWPKLVFLPFMGLWAGCVGYEEVIKRPKPIVPPIKHRPVPQVGPPEAVIRVARTQIMLNDAEHLLSASQRNAFERLVGATSNQELDIIEQSLVSLRSNLKTATSTKMKEHVYDALSSQLNFSSVYAFRDSVTTVNELLDYRIHLNRPISKPLLNRNVGFVPSLDTLKQLRGQNSLEWQNWLEARSKISGTASRVELARTNWFAAEKMVADAAALKTPVTVGWIHNIHKALYTIPNCANLAPGQFRIGGNEIWVSGTPHQYIAGRYVPMEVNAFIEWLNMRLDECVSRRLKIPYIILLAAQAAQWFVAIHPFADGNGRTSRLIMDYVLQRNGILPPQLSRWIEGNPAKLKDTGADDAFNLVWEGVHLSYKTLMPGAEIPVGPDPNQQSREEIPEAPEGPNPEPAVRINVRMRLRFLDV